MQDQLEGSMSEYDEMRAEIDRLTAERDRAQAELVKLHVHAVSSRVVSPLLSQHENATDAYIQVANQFDQLDFDVTAFTTHVGAPTFKEAVDVLLRTKASDEDTIEEQFNKIKEMAIEIEQLKASK